MDRIKIVIKTGLVLAIISLLIGCALSQGWSVPEAESQYKLKVESQNQIIDRLTARLIKVKRENLALKDENKKLKNDKLRLIRTKRKLKKYNQELAMKIDMLKTLDHRVEEKRKNYSND